MRKGIAAVVLALAVSCTAPAATPGSATPEPLVTAAVAPSSTPSPSPTARPFPVQGPADRFGVSFSGNELDARGIPALKALGKDGAGIRWVRIELRWDRIEPRPGVRNFAQYDPVVAAARDQGFSIMAMLSYGNPNNTSVPAGATPAPSFSHPASFYPLTWAPKDFDAFRRYVGDVVAHYKDAIRAWQVWNEPTLYDYWRSGPSAYARLLAETASAVKAQDPNGLVIMGGLTFGGPISEREGNARFADQDFLPLVLNDRTYPGSRYADVIDVHVYSYGRGAMTEPKARVDHVRAELAKAGVPDKPIWIGEVGYASDVKGQLDPDYRGPDAQSRWLRDTFLYVTEQLRVEKVFWFTLVDTSQAGGDKYATTGLLDADLKPKQTLDAYKALIAAAR